MVTVFCGYGCTSVEFYNRTSRTGGRVRDIAFVVHGPTLGHIPGTTPSTSDTPSMMLCGVFLAFLLCLRTTCLMLCLKKVAVVHHPNDAQSSKGTNLSGALRVCVCARARERERARARARESFSVFLDGLSFTWPWRPLLEDFQPLRPPAPGYCYLGVSTKHTPIQHAPCYNLAESFVVPQ